MSQSQSRRVDDEFLKQWFHIARKQFPLDHYDLLGIERGEQDQQTIVQAAKLRVATLRKVKDQDHRDNVKAAHKQVLAAANCLCNAKQRAAYDLRLDQRDSSSAGRQKTQRIAITKRQQVAAGTKKPSEASNGSGHNLRMPSPHLPAKTTSKEEPASPVGAAGWLSKREWLFLGIGMGAMLLVAMVAIVGVVVVMKNDANEIAVQPPATEENSPTENNPNNDQIDDGELNTEHAKPVAGSALEHLMAVPSENLPSGPQEPPPSTGDEAASLDPSAGVDASSNPRDQGSDSSSPETPLGAQSPAVESETSSSVVPMPSMALETEVELPKSDMIDKDTSGESVSLGTVPGSMIDAVKLDLDSKYVNLSGFHRFELRPMEGSTGRWEVMTIKHKVIGKPRPEVVDTGIDFERPLAFIAPIGEELMFSWNSQNTWAFGENRDNEFAGQLSNCILIVRHSGKKHAIHLRRLERKLPLVLKLEEKREQIQLVLHDLPPHETLALKITELKRFKVATEMNPIDGRISLDKRGRIELYVGNKKQIRLRVEADANENGVDIWFSPFFKSGTHYEPLTPKSAKQALFRKQRLLNESEGDLRAAIRNFDGAQTARKNLGPPPRDIKQNRNWQIRAGALDNAMKKADSTINRKIKMIPGLEKVIADLKKMGEIATTLQDNLAAIEYRITTTVDQEERPLLIADLKLPESGDTDSVSATEMDQIRGHLKLVGPDGRSEFYAMSDGTSMLTSRSGGMENAFQNPDARGGADVLARLVEGNSKAQLPAELQVLGHYAMPRGHANLGGLPRGAPFGTLRRTLR